MAKVARMEPGTVINHGEHVFEFGDDGTRHVTEEEVQVLAEYEQASGFKVPIEEVKAKKGGDG